MTIAQKMTQWADANGVGELQAATIDARSRLSDSSIGTQVEAGKFRVVRTVYGRNTTVTPISGWLNVSDAVTFLRAYEG
jgi:hypothetical protein